MRVDAHHHLWDPAKGYEWLQAPGLEPLLRPFTVDELRTELRAAGIDKTVLVEAARCSLDEVIEFLSIADETPEIAGVVGWIDLLDPALADRLDEYRSRGDGRWLVGARAQIQSEDDPDYLGRPDVQRGLAAVAEAGLVYDLVVRVDQLASCAAVAQAVPELVFVLDHLGKPRIRDARAGLDEWSGPIAAVAACPNVACKLSGMVTEADPSSWTVADLRPFVEMAVQLFGVERVMFGSDWPVCLLAGSYEQVRHALEDALPPLSGAEQELVFGGTAERIYGLS